MKEKRLDLVFSSVFNTNVYDMIRHYSDENVMSILVSPYAHLKDKGQPSFSKLNGQAWQLNISDRSMV